MQHRIGAKSVNTTWSQGLSHTDGALDTGANLDYFAEILPQKSISFPNLGIIDYHLAFNIVIQLPFQ